MGRRLANIPKAPKKRTAEARDKTAIDRRREFLVCFQKKNAVPINMKPLAAITVISEVPMGFDPEWECKRIVTTLWHPKKKIAAPMILGIGKRKDANKGKKGQAAQ